MTIGRATFIDDDGTGAVGDIWNAALANSAFYDKIDALVGDWTAISFSAGNFTASAGSWTVASGDVSRNRYQVINKTLYWNFVLVTTTLSATPANLRIAIPTGNFLSTLGFTRVAYVNDNGTIRECLATPGDATHLYITRSDAGNFATQTDALSLYLEGWWELA